MRDIIIVLVSFLFFSSCIYKDERKVIASINEKELELSVVLDEMPNHIEDSAYFVEKFINNWIRKELLLSHAEMNINMDLFEFEKQIEDYRESLLIFAYQQEILNQNFDTMISSLEIQDYYNQFKDEFVLNENLFKGRFIVVDKLAPNLNFLNKWYKSQKETIFEDLEDYCQQFAKQYHIDDEKWMYFSIFNKRLPNFIKDEEYFLKNTKGVFFEDNLYRYYVFIKDYQIKGGVSPLSIERQKIKDLLLNKKKISFLNQFEDELYQNALAKKKIKIY